LGLKLKQKCANDLPFTHFILYYFICCIIKDAKRYTVERSVATEAKSKLLSPPTKKFTEGKFFNELKLKSYKKVYDSCIKKNHKSAIIKS
jgi:hypothetical protein